MLRGLDPLVSKGGNLTHMHDCPNFYFKAKDLISPSAFRSFPRGANSPAELGRLATRSSGARRRCWHCRAALWRRAGNIVEIDHATKGKGHNGSCDCRSVARFELLSNVKLALSHPDAKAAFVLFSHQRKTRLCFMGGCSGTINKALSDHAFCVSSRSGGASATNVHSAFSFPP